MYKMPAKKTQEVEALILKLLVAAAKASKVKSIWNVPVSHPDYAEAYGVHRGYLIGIYGSYDQDQRISLPSALVLSANDWWRSLMDRADDTLTVLARQAV